MDSFKNIKSLKDTTDQNDIFRIAKMNCPEVSGTPSYIFKTSQKSENCIKNGTEAGCR